MKKKHIAPAVDLNCDSRIQEGLTSCSQKHGSNQVDPPARCSRALGVVEVGSWPVGKILSVPTIAPATAMTTIPATTFRALLLPLPSLVRISFVALLMD